MRSSCLTPTFASLSASLALALSASPLRAQIDPGGDTGNPDPNAAAAYMALTVTPVGALAPVISLRDVGMGSRTLGFRFQFGNIDEQGPLSRRGFAGGIDIPVGKSASLGFTAGYEKFACDEKEMTGGDPTVDVACRGTLMAGANMSAPLLRSAVGGADGGSFTLGIDGALGYGTGDLLELSGDNGSGGTSTLKLSAHALSAAVSIPLSLAVRYPNVVLVPHLRPGFGYGRATEKIESNDAFFGNDEQTESGTRFLLGGGVALLAPAYGIGLDVGVQKVFIKDGKTLIGLGVTFGR